MIKQPFMFEPVSRFNFNYLDKHYSDSGIYLMEFPNKMCYLGKSIHVNQRIRQHFKDFSIAHDWHQDARETFTKIVVPPFPRMHPDWKRMSRQRQEILNQEIEEWKEIRYKMAIDFFKKVKLLVWKVAKEDITLAENMCLNQIKKEDKQYKYYNTAYPADIRGDYDEFLFT